jgi:hypothetical protein
MKPESSIPTAAFWASVLMLLIGAVSLIGSLFHASHVKSLLVAGLLIVLMVTAALILRNHTLALPFALLCASFLTVGEGYDILHSLHSSAGGVFQSVLASASYWGAFLLYRKWRLRDAKPISSISA